MQLDHRGIGTIKIGDTYSHGKEESTTTVQMNLQNSLGN